MKAAAIERALGHSFAAGHHSYAKAPTFETSDGRVIGVVRHYYDGHGQRGTRQPDWHYHETGGVGHPTRTIDAADIVRVKS